jgi:hypothetical protein
VSWTPAEHPLAPSFTPDVAVVDDAVVTGFAKGRVRMAPRVPGPRDWMTGAVHDAEGRLVEASLRSWAGDRSSPVSVDPDVVPVRGRRRLAGTWHYAGHWSAHFGHFVLEVLPGLWTRREGLDGVLCHRSLRVVASPRRAAMGPPELSTWQRDLLDLAGWGDLPIQVVRGRPVRVDRLVVPARPVLLKYWAAPEAVAVWRRTADASGEAAVRRLFLSRTRFNARGASTRGVEADPAWDRHLDAAAARHGFTVVHPEELPVREQVALVAGADVIAGSAGSALHLSAFARPGTRVLEIGDRRTPTTPMPTQRMVDAACGHLTLFAPYLDEAAVDAALADA